MKKFLTLNLLLLIIALGDIFFFYPSNIVSGGLYSLAMIIRHYFKINVSEATYNGSFVFLVNIPLLIYSYYYFEREYFNQSFYCTLALPIYEILLDRLLIVLNYKPTEYSLYLSLILGTVIQAIGVAAVMALGGSTGGLDIVARIVNKYFNKISLGTAFSIFCLIIIGLSLLVFEQKRIIASVISVFLNGYLMDTSLKYLFNIEDVNAEYRGKSEN